VATLIVGVVWAAWHIPSYFIAYTKADMGNPYLLTLLGMAVNVAVAFPYAYCWGLSRNILPLVLMHAVHDVAAQLLFFGTPAVPGLSEGSKALIDITYPAPLLMMLIAAVLLMPAFIWLFRRTEAREGSAGASGDTLTSNSA
jgi:membrane protease YdiL (CAAX protease family)